MTTPHQVLRRQRAHAWEQQDEEPRDAYLAFKVFREMDAAERNVRQAYFLSQGRPPADSEDNAPSWWYERSHKWQWRERVLLFDRANERLLRAKLQERKLKSLVEIADLGETLRRKAQEAARLLAAGVEEVRTDADGGIVVTRKAGLTPEQIAKLAEVGVKIEQLALGNPTERSEVVGDDEKPLTLTIESAKDALRRRLEAIRVRRAAAEVEGDVAVAIPDMAIAVPEGAVVQAALPQNVPPGA